MKKLKLVPIVLTIFIFGSSFGPKVQASKATPLAIHTHEACTSNGIKEIKNSKAPSAIWVCVNGCGSVRQSFYPPSRKGCTGRWSANGRHTWFRSY